MEKNNIIIVHYLIYEQHTLLITILIKDISIFFIESNKNMKDTMFNFIFTGKINRLQNSLERQTHYQNVRNAFQSADTFAVADIISI